MPDPLQAIRSVSLTPAAAIRWACVLEATAPKVGNVYPGRPFDDLSYRDFVDAAEIAAQTLSQRQQPMSLRILDAVQLTVSRLGSNVNLGILLLLGPLVAADQSAARSTNDEPIAWQSIITEQMRSLDSADGANVFQAIALASPGGLGQVDQMDVNQSRRTESIDLLAAMRLAADRDRVAKQYSTGFRDLLESVVPLLESSIARHGDLLGGIAGAHLSLLAAQTDSLILRKNGMEVATDVQRRAAGVAADDPNQVAQLDHWLRDHPKHRLNPGTTADLIAAAMYVLLRSPRP